ncbi:hypothetical protein [Borreliella bavariensis]|uniref:hypothetical protein n=1 Tax=Borreliella bavariensis TaxID=664662 RepID=UPI001C0023F9|nr:hypothetical protein [Borreliella bavariensis]
MRRRFFYIYLSLALIFMFSCSALSGAKGTEGSNLTDKQRLEILNNIKSHLGGDSEKIAKVDKYFEQFNDSKRDVVLQVFSIGFKYINDKESEPKDSANRSANLAALKSDFESKLKKLNYTEQDFEKLADEFVKFIDPSA